MTDRSIIIPSGKRGLLPSGKVGIVTSGCAPCCEHEEPPGPCDKHCEGECKTEYFDGGCCTPHLDILRVPVGDGCYIGDLGEREGPYYTGPCDVTLAWAVWYVGTVSGFLPHFERIYWYGVQEIDLDTKMLTGDFYGTSTLFEPGSDGGCHAEQGFVFGNEKKIRCGVILGRFCWAGGVGFHHFDSAEQGGCCTFDDVLARYGF